MDISKSDCIRVRKYDKHLSLGYSIRRSIPLTFLRAALRGSNAKQYRKRSVSLRIKAINCTSVANR